jgi:hypothetical protein
MYMCRNRKWELSMRLARQTLVYAAICFQCLGASAVEPVQAEDQKKVIVQFVTQRDEDTPRSGEISCEISRFCTITDQEKPDFVIRFKAFREQGTLVGELLVTCGTDCGFSNYHTSQTFTDKGRFEIRSGEAGREIPLVLKPRKRLGEIVVRYRPAEN